MDGTRDRIVASALELFSSRGFNGTGIKALTQAAATTTGSVYHFFPDGKDGLAVAAVAQSGAEHEALFEAFAAAHADPGDAVGAFFDAVADALEDRDFCDLCPIGTIAAEVASTHDDIRVAADQVFASWTRALQAHLVHAGLATADAGELAETVVAALLGGFVLVRCRRDGEPVRAAGRQLRELLRRRVSDGPTPG